MPPWHADPRYGHFENDRSLTAAERATLLAWVDQGTPLGDPAKIPPAKTFAEGWIVGAPRRRLRDAAGIHRAGRGRC